MSNLSYFLSWFGPYNTAIHQQSPICRIFRCILDLFTYQPTYSVQSATFPSTLWTFSPIRLPTASNPQPTPALFGPFHLSTCLQRPIHNLLRHTLDFATYQTTSKVQQVQLISHKTSLTAHKINYFHRFRTPSLCQPRLCALSPQDSQQSIFPAVALLTTNPYLSYD